MASASMRVQAALTYRRRLLERYRARPGWPPARKGPANVWACSSMADARRSARRPGGNKGVASTRPAPLALSHRLARAETVDRRRTGRAGPHGAWEQARAGRHVRGAG